MTAEALSTHGKDLLDSTNAALSGAALTSPAWLPYLTDASNVAGLMMPLMGVAWLAVQIVHKTKEILKK